VEMPRALPSLDFARGTALLPRDPAYVPRRWNQDNTRRFPPNMPPQL
jgi:hypothetical protein